MTISGPAMRAAKNPSSCSTFIALPPLQLLRKSARRSSSASVSGACWENIFMGIIRKLRQHSTRHPFLRARAYSSRVPTNPFLDAWRTPLRQCRSRSASDSRASTNARLFLRLRRRRQQSVEAQIHRVGAVVIGPIVGQGDERKSTRAFATTEQLDLVCEL